MLRVSCGYTGRLNGRSQNSILYIVCTYKQVDNRGVHAVVRRPGGALAYAVYAVGTTRALTDSTFPTDHSALLGYSNGQAIQLATAAEVGPSTLKLIRFL